MEKKNLTIKETFALAFENHKKKIIFSAAEKTLSTSIRNKSHSF